MDFIRQFHLAYEDGGIGWDIDYYLVFTNDGQMFVRSVKRYEQPNKTPDIHEFYPNDFKTTLHNGSPLSQLVARRLKEILPVS